MIDYLEWEREEADALWEAVRQLTEQPDAAKEGNSRLDGQTGVEENVWPTEYALETAVEQGERLALRAAELGTEPRSAGRQRRHLDEEVNRSFRLEQRNVDDTSPDWLPLGQSGRETAIQGEMGRAERLDRIFRRDGRRYDGGFFLY